MTLQKNNLVEKIINFLLNILIFIFGAFLLVSVYTSTQIRFLGNDYANFFGYSIFEVQTGSMADTINAGDWIIVKLTPNVKLDDIVTYKLKGEYITHRVIEIYKGTYITKGDANSAKDEPVDQSQIIGNVVKVFPNFGILRKTLFNPSVLIALIITLFLTGLAFKKNRKEVIKEKPLRFDNNESFNNILDIDSDDLDKLGYYDLDDAIENELGNTAVHKTVSVGDNKPLVRQISNNEYKTGKDEVYKDSDLEKTIYYRMVSVDGTEVDDKYKSLIQKDESNTVQEDASVSKVDSATDTKEYEENKAAIQKDDNDVYREDELDKTSFYRIVPVDSDEIDTTFLEIAKNELKEAEQKDKNQEKLQDLGPSPEDDESEDYDRLTKINLDLLKSKKGDKKGKNIIDSVMIIKKDELNELLNTFIERSKPRVREGRVKDEFINTYVDAKYYDYYGERNLKYKGKSSILKIRSLITEVADELVNNRSDDVKYKDMVYTYAATFILIANLEQALYSITDIKAKNEFYKKEIIKYYNDSDLSKIEYTMAKIMKIQKEYADILDSFLKNLETNMFVLNYNKLTTKKNMYGLELQHNITFSKVYSDYIIDKTYTEGIIAEDKISVLFTLLSVQLLQDMFLSNFNRKYILYMPNSLYSKQRKLGQLLRMIDDKYAKDNIIILITFDDLLKNKTIIKQYRKMGYKFALVFDEDTGIKEKDRGYIYIADYIFVKKEGDNASKVLPFIPVELLDNIIFEDIIGKIGDFGSE